MADERTTAWRPATTGNPGGAFKVSTATGGEFSRFERLTRKLIKVPKTELDDKRRKS